MSPIDLLRQKIAQRTQAALSSSNLTDRPQTADGRLQSPRMRQEPQDIKSVPPFEPSPSDPSPPPPPSPPKEEITESPFEAALKSQVNEFEEEKETESFPLTIDGEDLEADIESLEDEEDKNSTEGGIPFEEWLQRNSSPKYKMEDLPPPISQDKNSFVSNAELSHLQKELEERNTERSQFKDILKELQQRLDDTKKENGDLKKQLQASHLHLQHTNRKEEALINELREKEKRYDTELRKKEDLQKELEKRTKAETFLQQELENTRKKLYEDLETESSIDAYNKSLEADLNNLRKRLETVTQERDQLQTKSFHLTEEVGDMKRELERQTKEREKTEDVNVKLEGQIDELRVKLQTETKERREAETLRNLSLEYRDKFNREWELRMASESRVSALERETIGLKKKLDNEKSDKVHLEEEYKKLEQQFQNLDLDDRRREEPSFQDQSQEEIKHIREETIRREEVLRKRIMELELLHQESQSLINHTNEKYLHERERSAMLEGQVDAIKRRADSLERDLEEIEDTMAPSLESRYSKLKRKHNSTLKQLESLQKLLSDETKKKEEIFLVKVRLERSLQSAKQQIEKLKSQPDSPARLSRDGRSPNRRASGEGGKYAGVLKEDLNAYVKDLLAKLNEQTAYILQLQEVNAELRTKTNSAMDSDFKSRLKMEEYARKLELELKKANQFIQTQHSEYSSKLRDLEDTRKKLMSTLTK